MFNSIRKIGKERTDFGFLREVQGVFIILKCESHINVLI